MPPLPPRLLISQRLALLRPSKSKASTSRLLSLSVVVPGREACPHSTSLELKLLLQS